MRQNRAYRERIIDKDCERTLVVEAGISFGWERFCAKNHAFVTIETFGASAPYKQLAEKYGFTVDNVVQKASELFKY